MWLPAPFNYAFDGPCTFRTTTAATPTATVVTPRSTYLLNKIKQIFETQTKQRNRYSSAKQTDTKQTDTKQAEEETEEETEKETETEKQTDEAVVRRQTPQRSCSRCRRELHNT